MNHEEAENFARKCAVGIGICIFMSEAGSVGEKSILDKTANVWGLI